MTPRQAVLDAMQSGEITPEQLRELITCEADEIGLTLEQAVDAARTGALPRNPIGVDLEYLIDVLEAA